MTVKRIIVALMLLFGFVVFAVSHPRAFAGEARPLSDDPQVEARLLVIAEDLRCLVCQNETLAASRAELAEDLRREIRNLIRQGKSDQEVLDFLVVRYGDFVRYRPPFKPTTWLLWGLPFLMLVAGLAVLYRVLKKQHGAAVEGVSS